MFFNNQLQINVFLDCTCFIFFFYWKCCFTWTLRCPSKSFLVDFVTFALSSPFIWTLAGITTSRSHFHDWNPISDVLNKVVRTAVIYMYWMDSNSGNMRVINPSWLVINAQLLHAVEQAHIYKLRTDLSYSKSLTIWVWLSASIVGVVSWKLIPQLTTYHLKTGSWTNTALVILQKEHFSGTVSCL